MRAFWLAMARAGPDERARAALVAVGNTERPPVVWVGVDRAELVRAVVAAATTLFPPAPVARGAAVRRSRRRHGERKRVDGTVDGAVDGTAPEKAAPDGAASEGNPKRPAWPGHPGWPPQVIARTVAHAAILSLLEPLEVDDLDALRVVVAAAWLGAGRYARFHTALWAATQRVDSLAAAGDALMADPQLAAHLQRVLNQWERDGLPTADQ